MNLWVYGFYKIWKTFNHYFFKYFSVVSTVLSSEDSNDMKPLEVFPQLNDALFTF